MTIFDIIKRGVTVKEKRTAKQKKKFLLSTVILFLVIFGIIFTVYQNIKFNADLSATNKVRLQSIETVNQYASGYIAVTDINTFSIGKLWRVEIIFKNTSDTAFDTVYIYLQYYDKSGIVRGNDIKSVYSLKPGDSASVVFGPSDVSIINTMKIRSFRISEIYCDFYGSRSSEQIILN